MTEGMKCGSRVIGRRLDKDVDKQRPEQKTNLQEMHCRMAMDHNLQHKVRPD